MSPRLLRRLALLVYLAGILAYRDSIMDDTFIHLQYARNLRESGELAFNRGEPSLGATSPLWMLLLAATGAGVAAARVFSVAAGALAVLAFAAWAERVLGRTAWAAAATIAWAGSLWLVRHAPNGMEATLAVACALGAAVLHAQGAGSARRDVLLGLALAGAALARPEAALLAALYALHDVARPASRARLAAWLPAFAVPCIAWAIFAHHATGQILPATLQAKSGGFGLAPRAWMRVARREAAILGMGHAVEMAGLAAAAILWARRFGREGFMALRRHPLALWGAFVAASMAGFVAIDLQVQPRYLMFAFPWLVLAGFAAWRSILGGRRFAAAGVCAASLCVGAASGAWRVWPATHDFARGVHAVLEPMARDLAGRGAAVQMVATPDIGVIGYFSGCRVLDLGGLVDPRLRTAWRVTSYETLLETGGFLDFGAANFVVDRAPEAARFEGHVTRGLHWRVLRTGAVRGLGISRPETVYYTLYALEPASAFGSGPTPASCTTRYADAERVPR